MEIMFPVSGKTEGAVKTTLNDLANFFSLFPPECNILRKYLKNQLFSYTCCSAVSFYLCSEQEVME